MSPFGRYLDRLPSIATSLKARWAWIALAGAFALGVVIRVLIYGQALYGDELSTWWIVQNNGLFGTISFVATDAEITPPFYFFLAKIATAIGSAPELIRLPSLLAGVGLVPVTFGLARLLISRRAAFIAAAVTSLSPMLIYFSATARAYSVMLLLIAGSTLFMLLAARDGRTRWWAGYATCVCLAMYTHYTAVFVLTGQFLWAVWALPPTRRPLIIATILAAIAFLPWLPSWLADLNSPTTKVLGGLEPDTWTGRWHAIEQVAFMRIGGGGAGLGERFDALLPLLGCLLAIGVLIRRALRRVQVEFTEGEVNHAAVLIVVLTLAAPVGTLLVSAVGTNVFGVRELASVWVGLPLLVAMVFAATGRTWAVIASALVLAGFAVGALRLADASRSGFAYREVAAWIDDRAGPDDAIIDNAVLSPSPATPLDLYLPQGRPEYRVNVPEDSPDYVDNIFNPPDPRPLIVEAFSGRNGVFVVAPEGALPVSPGGTATYAGEPLRIPRGWKPVDQQVFEGVVPIEVTEYDRARATGS